MDQSLNRIVEFGIISNNHRHLTRIICYINGRQDCLVTVKSSRIADIHEESVDVLIVAEIPVPIHNRSLLPLVYKKFPNKTIIYISDHFEFNDILWAVQFGVNGCFTLKGGLKKFKLNFESFLKKDKLTIPSFWLLKIILMSFSVTDGYYKEFNLSEKQITLLSKIEESYSIDEITTFLNKDIKTTSRIIEKIVQKVNPSSFVSLI